MATVIRQALAKQICEFRTRAGRVPACLLIPSLQQLLSRPLRYGGHHTSKLHKFWNLSGSCFFLNVCVLDSIIKSQGANLIHLIIHVHLGKPEAQQLA